MNKSEYLAHIESVARNALAKMDEDARLQRADGHVKQAERNERGIAHLRKRVERELAALPAKLDGVNARTAAMMGDSIAKLERIIGGSGEA
jgi:hypothetical protein